MADQEGTGGEGNRREGSRASDPTAFNGFQPDLFLRRRRAVLDGLEAGAMVVPAASPLIRSRDSELPYRPDSELFYLTGFAEPDSLLLLRGFADEDRAILFVRDRDAMAERWSGPRAGPEEAREQVGVDRTFPIQELSQRLPRLLEGAARVHFRLGAHPMVEPLVIQALREARRRGPRYGKGPRGVEDPGEILDELRLRKSPEEIQALREAVAVTMEGFRAGMATAAPGRGEWEIQAEVEAAFRRAGAQGPAFATIVGSGANGCVLHYVENRDRIAEGDLILLDAGAEVRMYSGDLTRTFPASGRFDPNQEAVYQVVEAARASAVAAVRPGATLQEIHQQTREVLIQGLKELGVLSGSMAELLDRKADQAYFPHRTSHWLGMDTHDPGDYVREGIHRRLEPGMVLTVEPGLYFPPPATGENPGHPFVGMGIRIEDDLVVTEEGAEVLSADLPTSPEAMAELVGRGR
jgi:Xaa-Pro aminopeptidase